MGRGKTAAVPKATPKGAPRNVAAKPKPQPVPKPKPSPKPKPKSSDGTKTTTQRIDRPDPVTGELRNVCLVTPPDRQPPHQPDPRMSEYWKKVGFSGKRKAPEPGPSDASLSTPSASSFSAPPCNQSESEQPTQLDQGRTADAHAAAASSPTRTMECEPTQFDVKVDAQGLQPASGPPTASSAVPDGNQLALECGTTQFDSFADTSGPQPASSEVPCDKRPAMECGPTLVDANADTSGPQPASSAVPTDKQPAMECGPTPVDTNADTSGPPPASSMASSAAMEREPTPFPSSFDGSAEAKPDEKPPMDVVITTAPQSDLTADSFDGEAMMAALEASLLEAGDGPVPSASSRGDAASERDESCSAGPCCLTPGVHCACFLSLLCRTN